MELYVARDKNGDLYLYTVKPKKIDDCWICSYPANMVELDKELYPEVKWEDDEPTEVKLII